MARIPKKNINTPYFHIMVQGINKEYIFECNENIEKYLKIMKKCKKEIDVTILAYCIMSNHAHLLIFTEDNKKIIEFMHKVNLLYAKFYNKKYDRVGYVFRDRYKTQPIFSERHLLCCIDYIHNNPVKAKICDSASKYYYSSYNENIFESDEIIAHNIKMHIDSRKLHKNEENEEFVLMENKEDKEELCRQIVKEFMIKNNLDKKELKNNKEMLKNLCHNLKMKYRISFRLMEKVIGISRETIRKLL